MKSKFVFCVAVILIAGFQLKADDADDHFDVVEELNANEFAEGYSNYCASIDKNTKLSADKFAVRTELGWITAVEYKRLQKTAFPCRKAETRIGTPFGSKEFCLCH
jgi:hypothetical protein